MCGIAGLHGKLPRTSFKAALDSIAHRGPDDSGIYEDDKNSVVLGHRRLSILDIHNGKQPMIDKDLSVALTFNGEIYNHAALRVELEGRGHRFRSSHSDTEVILKGYLEWGYDLPNHLNGMFAFAIYDAIKKNIFISRDRFGEKPLFYSEPSSTRDFMFGSELSVFKFNPQIDHTLDDFAIKKYFAYGYLPAPYTLLKGVRKLKHGTNLLYDLGTKRARTWAYWEYRLEPEEYFDNSEEDLATELKSLLEISVKERLTSDVPVGVLLSSGIDSNSIARIAANKIEQIKTFTVGFEDQSFDESRYVEKIALDLKSDHQTTILKASEMRDTLNRVNRMLDEPIADPSIIPTFLVCEFASKSVKVALGGDGADELFAGYDTFSGLGFARFANFCIPKFGIKKISRLIDVMPFSSKNMSLDYKVRQAIRGLQHLPSAWNPAWISPIDLKDLADLMCEKIDANDIYSEAIATWEKSTCNSLLERTLEFYGNHYLPDNILTKTDRASMLNGLELRSPFLDKNIAEFAMRTPPHLKYSKGKKKYLLKNALSEVLSDSIIKRPKKGFGIPTVRWLREMDFKNSLEIAEHAGLSSELLSIKWRQFKDGDRDHRGLFWSWMMLGQSQLFDQYRIES